MCVESQSQSQSPQNQTIQIDLNWNSNRHNFIQIEDREKMDLNELPIYVIKFQCLKENCNFTWSEQTNDTFCFRSCLRCFSYAYKSNSVSLFHIRYFDLLWKQIQMIYCSSLVVMYAFLSSDSDFMIKTMAELSKYHKRKDLQGMELFFDKVKHFLIDLLKSV